MFYPQGEFINSGILNLREFTVMKHDTSNIEKQPSINIPKSKPDKLSKPSNNIVGHSHDSFVKIWHNMYGINIKLVM